MKNIEYKCNIREGVVRDNKNNTKKSFVGFEFGSCQLQTANFRDVEQHICYTCLDQLSQLFKNKLENRDKNWITIGELK